MILMLATTPTPPVAIDPRPVVDDLTVMEMRPDGRRIGLLTVGPGKEHTSISDAVDAAHGMVTARKTAEGMTAETSPNYRVDVLIDPGEYVEVVSLSSWVSLYAADGVKGSVVLRSPASFPGGIPAGVLTTIGGCYVEGLHIIRSETSVTWPKYPIHHSNSRTTIFARCILDNQDSGSAGGVTTIGTDGAENGTTVLHDVDLISGGTNQHGWATTTTGHQTVVYSHVASSGVLDWNASNDVAPDEVWVVGGSAPSVKVKGAMSILHLDPASVVAGEVTAPTIDASTDWPIPMGGLSAFDRAHFGM